MNHLGQLLSHRLIPDIGTDTDQTGAKDGPDQGTAEDAQGGEANTQGQPATGTAEEKSESYTPGKRRIKKRTIKYNSVDVKERGVQPRVGDDVVFQIAKDSQSGMEKAVNIVVRHKYGVVVSMKNTFGFVEHKKHNTGYERRSPSLCSVCFPIYSNVRFHLTSD